MTARKWVPALVAVTVVGGASCQRSPQPGPAAEVRPSAPAPPAAVSGRRFEPPADGRLRAAQVEMYIAVRRQARALAKSSPTQASTAAGWLANLAASERRAVDELGRDVDEYRWVRERVGEASPPAVEALGGLAGAIEAAAREGSKQVLEKAARERPPVTPAQPGPHDAARAYNRGLLEHYRSELDALRTPSALPRPPAGPPTS